MAALTPMSGLASDLLARVLARALTATDLVKDSAQVWVPWVSPPMAAWAVMVLVLEQARVLEIQAPLLKAVYQTVVLALARVQDFWALARDLVLALETAALGWARVWPLARLGRF